MPDTNIGPYVAPLKGLEFTKAEQALYARRPPWGFILFQRNLHSPDQLRALCAQLHDWSAGAHIFMDQEGGRVQVLKPPVGQRLYPAAAHYRGLYKQDKMAACRQAHDTARSMAEELKSFGINIVCAPVLDLFQPDADAIIGDRSFGVEPTQVIDLGRAQIDGFLAGGVVPVIKHMPGHGRARVDSHAALPEVSNTPDELASHDFLPFQALADCPMAMTAHIAYTQLDGKTPATTSSRIVTKTIRQDMDFQGVLITDALEMKALTGAPLRRGQQALQAGCDLALYCSESTDMGAIVDGLGDFPPAALARCARLGDMMRKHKMAGYA